MASRQQEEYSSYKWVHPTIIEDDDLQFGGKALCEWYEEDRNRFSSAGGSDDGHYEEKRGRARTRKESKKTNKKA